MSKMLWTCKDGRKISPKDMTTDHLRNTIAMIERVYARNCFATALSASAYASTAPDGAAMCAESEADAAFEEAEAQEHLEEEYPIYRHLCAELYKRTPE